MSAISINLISQSSWQPPIASSSSVNEAGATTILHIFSCSLILQSLANKVVDLFKKLNDLHVFTFLAGIGPVVTSVISAVSVIKNIIQLAKACSLGLGHDLLNKVIDLVRDLLHWISSLMSTLPLIATIFKVIGNTALRVCGIVTGVIGLIVYVLDTIKESIGLYRTVQAKKIVEAILKRDDLTPQEKVEEIVTVFSERFKKQEEVNARHLEGVKKGYKQRAEEFLSEKMKEKMESTLGEHAYARMKEAIEFLNEGNHTQEEIFAKSVDCIRDVRDLLQSKIKKHIIEIVINGICIAATILGLVCPAFGAGMLVACGLWGLFVIIWGATKIKSYIADKHFKAENHFSSLQNGSEKDPVITDKVLDKMNRTLMNRVHPYESFANIENPSDAIAKILLSSKKLKAHMKHAKRALIEVTANKLKKNLINANLLSYKSALKLKIVSLGDLQSAWSKYEDKMKEMPVGNTLGIDFSQKWRTLEGRIKVIEQSNDRFYTTALKLDWTLLKAS